MWSKTCQFSLLNVRSEERPNIAQAVGAVGWYMNNPSKVHWEVVKWILRYQQGTTNKALCFKGGDTILTGYVDADLVRNVDIIRCTTGHGYTLGGIAMSWVPQLQKIVALSTIDAEYAAVTEDNKEMIWLQSFLEKLGKKQENNVLLWSRLISRMCLSSLYHNGRFPKSWPCSFGSVTETLFHSRTLACPCPFILFIILKCHPTGPIAVYPRDAYRGGAASQVVWPPVFKALELVVKKLLNQTEAAEFLVALSGIQVAIHQFAKHQKLQKGPFTVSVKSQNTVETSKQPKTNIEDRISHFLKTSDSLEHGQGIQHALCEFEEQQGLRKGPVTRSVRFQHAFETSNQPNIPLENRTNLGENLCMFFEQDRNEERIIYAISEFEDHQGLRMEPVGMPLESWDVAETSKQPMIHLKNRVSSWEKFSRMVEQERGGQGIEEQL
ncbi:Detected protein of unknown function [Hibiscus syriacus]|uniref:Uncharacterized protein n=1 Tax=Hibiscus syriacus TaxID=106335 RepID=A0A6A3B1M7_HIBSY|nr:Detected protein of unknown function [Hibiscus syriacus]